MGTPLHVFFGDQKKDPTLLLYIIKKMAKELTKLYLDKVMGLRYDASYRELADISIVTLVAGSRIDKENKKRERE